MQGLHQCEEQRLRVPHRASACAIAPPGYLHTLLPTHLQIGADVFIQLRNDFHNLVFGQDIEEVAQPDIRLKLCVFNSNHKSKSDYYKSVCEVSISTVKSNLKLLQNSFG